MHFDDKKNSEQISTFFNPYKHLILISEDISKLFSTNNFYTALIQQWVP